VAFVIVAQDSTAMTVLLVVVLVLGLVAWYLASCAARLDRLHHRVEAASAALDNQLLRRASASRSLAASGLLDPASALLVAGAAAEALSAGEDLTAELAEPAAGRPSGEGVAARESAESDLSRALRATLTPDVVTDLQRDPLGDDLLADLGAAAHRAWLARRFHNDAVSQARRVRAKRLVRVTRLAGRAPWPQTFEMDDEVPDQLER
jgi:hypothetical protein